MASNPLARRREQPANDLRIGIVRTSRPYVYDLCDAYNAAMSPDARHRGAEWYVAPNGELKLGDNAAWSRKHFRETASRQEAERQRFIRNQRPNGAE